MLYSNWDFIYPVFMLIFGIVMILSPRTFMRKAKYDEDSVKAESWVKKAGIGLAIMAPLLAFFIYYKMNM
ncbi:hypothetical protein [Prevotella sp. 10(H)]|uniref:hypothetical protein n=1 Tax=Prevotella sp. 10(H) TaxID=1158294 RepID=UPI0004A71F05|nr:hypothetical protein [Prevotella sp. 10(H)]